MLFTPDNATKVTTGQKAQTRRPVKEGDKIGWAGVPGDSPVVVRRNGRIIWQEGQTYAIQPGRTKPAIGYATIKTIQKERLQDITPEDCFREGVVPKIINYPIDPIGLFYTLWDSIYSKRPGLRWVDNPEVWVIEFKPKASPVENYRHGAHFAPNRQPSNTG